MPRTLLIIDDSRTVREVLKVYLMGNDYTFIEAEDGERALEIIRSARVDLVLADINLPKMDGLAFLRDVRASASKEQRRVPVVLISSDKTATEKQKSKVALADAFLPKPVQREQLLRVVGELLRESGA